MRSLCILLALFYAAILANAQKNEMTRWNIPYREQTCHALFPGSRPEAGLEETQVRQYLTSALPNLTNKQTELQLKYRRESLSGVHFSYTQTYLGIPVYQSEIKVNLDKRGRVISVFDNSCEVENWNLTAADKPDNAVIAFDRQTQEPVVAALITDNHFYEVLIHDGREIYRTDLRGYVGVDSVVSGRVFNPDPLTTAGQVYDTATIYKDNNNANAPWIEAQMQTVNLTADFDGANFNLRNPFIKMTDFEAPNLPPVTVTEPEFNFLRPDPGLEDVNAYYHADYFRKYVSDMGFDCADHLVEIDAHAGLADLSYFIYTYTPPRIYLGVGGVPDAQDADVVIHEYGHFLSYQASPESNAGFERNALDEGFCDYLAASYSRSINAFKEEWVFNWDGHNEFWRGRVVNSTKRYPNDMSNTSIYRDAEIWSSMLFQLNTDLGRGVADSLIIEAHYHFAQNISMADAAKTLLMVDTLLFNGQHFCSIYGRLFERGLVSFRANDCGISSVNNSNGGKPSWDWIQHRDGFTIVCHSAADCPTTLDIYSITGAKLLTVNNDNVTSGYFRYRNGDLPPGLYIVRAGSNNFHTGLKWMKTE